MRVYPLLLATVAVLFSASSVQAQRRTKGFTVLQPQVQAELPLSGNDYLFGALNLQHFDTDLEATPLFSGQGLRLGYEHFFNDQWSWGAVLNGQRVQTTSFYSAASYSHFLLPEVFGRHWNTLGSVNFRQRLAIGYTWPLDVANSGRFLASLRLDVDRIFPLGSSGLALRPRLALEPVTYLRFQRDANEAKEPFLDFSELRGEVGVRLSPRFDFTPWFSWQNSYSIALPQYNADGTVKIPGGNSRYVQPAVGLDLRITLGKNAGSAERRQLPTQY
ncbi:hypothetical protein [Hymenobacter metallilatus]|uniref:DUF2490 domain-containing protein n=1 Tax=Hymenobacter metallilatus TaxID=2493666 RepID=A0A428JPF4_9BACT|nr:hypothetical protein [Hymenobacter metallilatus]RSK35249.1 hypothetical protein EI290_05995 [Hymenobacter metallilatus]